MDANRYDVAVIGAGPAGAAAAYVLSSYGMKVCLVDKYTFPRKKLCGGLLTIRTQRIFNEIFNTSWDSVIEFVSDGVRFYYIDTLLNEVKGYKKLFFTNRMLFDNFIAEQAVKSGVKTYFGMSAVGFDANNKIITLDNGREITSDFIVGADGVNSAVSKHLFGKSFDLDHIGFGLEIELDRDTKYADRTYPEIYFGVIKWGYGWVFPKRDTLTVGIGGRLKLNPDMTEKFMEFLNKVLKVSIDKSTIKGHHIPFGHYKKIPGKNNAILCGDAAGLVDPITGEGIAFALQSGKYAAEAIIEASKHNNPNRTIDIYLEKYRKITDMLRQANRLRYLLFPEISESLFIRVLPETDSIPRKHIDLMSGDISYGDYVGFLLSKIFSGGIKHLFGIK
ncbi:MAG TPA: NAD(P)/FAD-dependent oxidoreductase [Thermoguttaceae bacterium]